MNVRKIVDEDTGATLRYVARYRDADRRQRQGSFATKREAEQWLAKQVTAVATGTHVTQAEQRTTVADWVATWQAGRPRGTAQAAKEASVIKCHVLPQWGSRRIGSIRQAEVRAWVIELLEDYTPDTVRTFHGIFSSIMKAAAEERLAPTNPCTLPRGTIAPRDPDSIVFVTAAQRDAIIAAAPDRWRATVRLAFFTGMRWGEIAGLRWTDLDLATGRVHVRRALKEVSGRLSFGPPKTRQSLRTLDLDPDLVAALLHHQVEYGNGELVFCSSKGTPLYRGVFRRDVWSKTVKAAGVEPAPTFHATRHYFASMLIDEGVDVIEVSHAMGHARPSITSDRYGHRYKGSDKIKKAIERSKA